MNRALIIPLSLLRNNRLKDYSSHTHYHLARHMKPPSTAVRQSRKQDTFVYRNMILRIHLLWVLLGLYATTETAVPEAPRAEKSKNHGQDVKSGRGFKQSPNTAIVFEESLTDKPVGYNRENGIFTASCAGLYTFSFTVTGENSRFSFRKRPSPRTSSWNTIITTGKSGGSYTIFLNMEAGEEAAVFLDSGSLSASSHIFSGYCVSKKI